jgi:DNA-binding transcriptional ArsR family regulator
VVVVFDVIAERHRRQILDLLRLRERSVGELVKVLAVSQPAVSKHLRLLRDAGLVESRVEAQRRVYRVRVEPLLEVDEWLAPYRMLWSASLNRLERHLDQMDDESPGG